MTTSRLTETTLAGVQTRQRITPHALLETKRISEPRLHPDGVRVAYVVTEADFEESTWISHIWLTEYSSEEECDETIQGVLPLEDSMETPDEDDDEELTRQLTFSYQGETRPLWSPDGRYLAFLSSRPDESESTPDDDEEPHEQVWVLPIDGGEARRVTSFKEGVLEYCWHPDSAELILLTCEHRPAPIEELRKQDREDKKIDPIVEHEDLLKKQFWRVDIDDRKPVRICTADPGVLEFALSPDGNQLIYTTNRTGIPNDYHIADIWLLRLEDREQRLLCDRPGGKSDLRWSPGGDRISFLSWLDPTLSYSRESLFLIKLPADPFTSLEAPIEPKLLTNLDYDLSGYEWLPKEEMLVVLATVKTGSAFYCVDAATGKWSELIQFSGEIGDFSLNTAGTGPVWVQEGSNSLPEIWLRTENGEVITLAKPNAEFTRCYQLPKLEVISWQSEDGLTIEGVLTYPIGWREGDRCPLLVDVHGGPKGRSSAILRGYMMPGVWSAQGYAVLSPNFRGSEGYGNAFAIANRRDLGGGDFRDIMAGVDYCIQQGIADPNRLGIMGGSYGGYMTNWAIGHTDRFKASISMFGIFHLQTDYSNSDYSRWDHDYLDAYYWQDPEIYRKLSPGSYLEKINTPTLIIHGEDDNNTSISNSRELYQALRHRDVTTRFVRYPREGHGLREPNHKLDEIRRCLEWMDRYVRHIGEEPARYRIGDQVRSSDNLWELCVCHAEPITPLGESLEVSDHKGGSTKSAKLYLEVLLTIHHLDSRQSAETVTLRVDQLILELPPSYSTDEEMKSGTRLKPHSIPLDLPGGKILLEGENLRLTQHPDPQSGQLAFAISVVYLLTPQDGEGLFYAPGFPPISLNWQSEPEEEEPGLKP